MAQLTPEELQILHGARRPHRNQGEREREYYVGLTELYDQFVAVVQDLDAPTSALVDLIGEHGTEVLGPRIPQHRGTLMRYNRSTLTVLMHALGAGNVAAVTVLCHAMSDAQFRAWTEDWDTALHMAAIAGPGEAARQTREIGVIIASHMEPKSLDVGDEMDMTPLQLAALKCNLELVRVISERWPRAWSTCDGWGRTALHMCSTWNAEMLSLACKYAPASAFEKGPTQKTASPLMAALKTRSRAVVEAFLARTPPGTHVPLKWNLLPFTSRTLAVHRNNVTEAAAFADLDIFLQIAERAEIPDECVLPLFTAAAKRAAKEGNLPVLKHLADTYGEEVILGDVDDLLLNACRSSSVDVTSWVLDFDPAIDDALLDPENARYLYEFFLEFEPEVVECVIQRLLSLDRERVITVCRAGGVKRAIEFNCLHVIIDLVTALPEIFDEGDYLHAAVRVAEGRQVAIIVDLNPRARLARNDEGLTAYEAAVQHGASQELLDMLKTSAKGAITG